MKMRCASEDVNHLSHVLVCVVSSVPANLSLQQPNAMNSFTCKNERVATDFNLPEETLRFRAQLFTYLEI